MKKQEPFPYTRLLLESVPADAVLNPKTYQRRKKNPGDLTLNELRNIIIYKSAQGMPVDLLRDLIRKDLA